MDVPLRCVTGIQARTALASYLPLRVKGKFIYFILDKKGEYTNPELFDHLINVRRHFWSVIESKIGSVRNSSAFIFECNVNDQ